MAISLRRKRGGKKAFTPLDLQTQPTRILGDIANPGFLSLYEGLFATHGAVYQSQPNVRTIVDFLARNVAQVGWKLYERVGDTDRQELFDHPLAHLLNHPNPLTTRYQMVFGTVADLAIYDNAFWIKQVALNGQMALVRVPPEYMTVYGTITPRMYRLWFPGGQAQDFTPDMVVHIHGYHPTRMTDGVSPMETLQNIIAEDVAASRARRIFWKRGARMDGLIKRPADAPEFSQEAKERFLAEWEAVYAGEGNSGRTGLLEEGMDWVPYAWSPKDSEFIAGRQLTMAQVAREYHVPLPMVGLTDSANFASIKEYHQMLYSETLPPWFAWVQEEVERQLFGDFSGLENAYLEFNVAEKLRGQFEDQAAILSTSVGGPWLTRNEARARLNLPPIDGGDELIVPLNVITGGQSSPQTPELPTEVPPPKALEPGIKALAARVRSKSELAHETVLVRHFNRQKDVILASQKAAKPYDLRRWNKELAADLLPVATSTTVAAGQVAMRSFGEGIYDSDLTTNFLKKNVEIAADNVNRATRDALKGSDLEGIRHVFEVAVDARAPALAITRATSLASFATHEAAKQAGQVSKTWVVTSGNSRHPELDGETVHIGSNFSNSLAFPGDPQANSADDTAGCTCLLDYHS